VKGEGKKTAETDVRLWGRGMCDEMNEKGKRRERKKKEE
jgi:hypothetical protein